MLTPEHNVFYTLIMCLIFQKLITALQVWLNKDKLNSLEC